MPAVGGHPTAGFFALRSSACLGACARRHASMRRAKLLIIERKAQTSFGTAMRGTIFECERAAVSFGDLPAENQTDARASLLGGEKRHKKIRSAGDSWAIVLNPHFDAAVLAFPADAHAAAGFESSVHRIVQQIDQ